MHPEVTDTAHYVKFTFFLRWLACEERKTINQIALGHGDRSS